VPRGQKSVEIEPLIVRIAEGKGDAEFAISNGSQDSEWYPSAMRLSTINVSVGVERRRLLWVFPKAAFANLSAEVKRRRYRW
jgi:hypothetical protein